MRMKTAIGVVTLACGAALTLSTAADAGPRARGGFGGHHGGHYGGHYGGQFAGGSGHFGGGARGFYRGERRAGWRAAGYGLAAGVAAGYAGAAYAASSDGYAPAYGYAPSYTQQVAAPQTTRWRRSYATPMTVYQPVTTTSYVPVTSYRAVQSTRYVPQTAYRQVTQTCTCTTDGVATQVPCAGGDSTAVRYNRPGLFTSGW